MITKELQEQIYQQYFATVLAAVSGQFSGRSNIDCSELVTEAFLQLMEQLSVKSPDELKKFLTTTDLGAYLYRIAYNRSLDYIGREEKRKEIHDIYLDINNTSQIPSSNKGATDIWTKLEQLMNNKDFGVLLSRSVEGLTYNQIAELYDLGTANNARLVFHRARKRSQDLLNGQSSE